MNLDILDNGVRFIYKKNDLGHTSFCIGLEAGANREDMSNIGVAHALEHMIFKGTKNYDEVYINKKLDEIFAMNNAMTNFPYTIYYGVTANDDFEEGFNLYSDIVLNPVFKVEGFEEEMSIIKEESREWSEDVDQLCEDLLFGKTFKGERINNTIIGSIYDVERITLEDIKKFYNKFYVSGNMTVTVVTSLDYEYVKSIVMKNFGALIKRTVDKSDFKRVNFLSGIYKHSKLKNDSVKIQIAYDISNLGLNDITLLRVFNMYFGDGVSSILYDKIRTQNGLAYEVYSEVKWEKGIRIFKIVINTSKEHKNLALKLIDEIEDNIDKIIGDVTIEKVNILLKRYKLKLSLEMERSIVLANRSTIYDVMFGEYNYIEKELIMEHLNINRMKEVVKGVFNNRSVMILE